MTAHTQPLASLSPFVRFAANPLRAAWRVERRLLRDFLLFHVESGHGELTFDDATIPLEPGGWYCVPPRTPHVLEGFAPPQMCVPYVHFDAIFNARYATLPMAPAGFLDTRHPAIQRDVFAEAGMPLKGRLHPKVFGDAKQQLLRLIELFERQSPFSRMESSGLLLQLLANLLEGTQHPPQSDAAEAVRYLEISLAEDRVHRLRSSELTAQTGYHPVHLGRLFKQQKGVTPREYQRRLKINRAKDLLRHTNLSLTAIAAQCGFSSLALFSRTFRQLEGLSPTEYITGKH